MKKCIKCGFENKDVDSFCMNCGTLLSSNNQTNTNMNNTNLNNNVELNNTNLNTNINLESNNNVKQISHCPHCGAELIDPTLRFCSSCGKLVEGSIITENKPIVETTKPKKKFNFVLIIVCVVAILIAIYLIFASGKRKEFMFKLEESGWTKSSDGIYYKAKGSSQMIWNLNDNFYGGSVPKAGDTQIHAYYYGKNQFIIQVKAPSMNLVGQYDYDANKLYCNSDTPGVTESDILAECNRVLDSTVRLALSTKEEFTTLIKTYGFTAEDILN